MEIQLRAVESAVPFVNLVGNAGLFDGFAESVGGNFPQFIAAHGVFRTGGQFHMVFQAEYAVHLLVHGHALDDFFLHLVLGHENVGIVLGEAAYTEEAVESAAQFMTMNQAEFTDPHGQIPVGTLLGLEIKDSAGAVHRFNCIVFIVDLGEVHIFLVMIPVAGLNPKLLGKDDRCHDFHITEFLEQLSFIIHEHISESHALWMEERESRAFIMEGEEVQLLAQLSVISLFRFSADIKEMVQVFLLEESGSVDTLQHLVLGITAPVSAGYGHNLEYLHLAGGTHMRAGAEVCEITLFVEGNLCIFRKIIDKHDLVVLALVLEELQCFGTGNDLLHQRNIFLGNLGHFLFNGCEIFLAEYMFRIQVIVEAVINGRSDGKLGAREQMLDSLGHYMGSGMAQSKEAFLIFLCEKFNLSAVHNGITEVCELTVHLGHNGIPAKAVGNSLRCISQGYGRFKLLFLAVFQFNRNHANLPFSWFPGRWEQPIGN